MLDLGIMGQYLSATERERDAYMLGVRVGVEGRMDPSSVGVSGTCELRFGLPLSAIGAEIVSRVSVT